MAITVLDGAGAGALWQRLVGSQSVLDADALLRQAAERLIAEAIMCNPAYVLTIEERERLTGSSTDSGSKA